MAYRIDTVAARAKLKPRREPYWLPLGDITGGYVGFRRGPETWIARLYEDGRQRYHQLGQFKDHRAALRAAREWITAIRQGVKTVDATVADACRAYVANLAKIKSPRASQEARSRLHRRILGRTPEEARALHARPVDPHPLAKKKLAKLCADDLTKWRDALVPDALDGEARRKARASANRELATLLAVLNYAHRQQMVASAVAWAGIGKFGDVQSQNGRRYVSCSERAALLEAAKSVQGGAIRPLLEALMLTGARPIELCRATVADYDKGTGMLTLRSFKGKSNEPRQRHVPLKALGAEAAFKEATKGKLPTAPLFTRDDGKAWGHSDWDHLVREARKAAKLTPLTAYDLRHSFITEAITGGVDPLTVARIAGTSMEMISRAYGKLIEDHAAKAFANVRLI